MAALHALLSYGTRVALLARVLNAKTFALVMMCASSTACSGFVIGTDGRDGGTDAGASPTPRDTGVPPVMDAGVEAPPDTGPPPIDAAVDAPPPEIDSGPTGPVVMDPGDEGDGNFRNGPAFQDAPEVRVPDGTPRGRIYPFTMRSQDSAIFPGVTGPYQREGWVYVPRQYVDGTEAPFMVVQDGRNYRDTTSAVFDSMIAAGELPHIIGIFINPGPGDGPGSERGWEYDRVHEDYTTFIETEVLPMIPQLENIRADYDDLRFTSDPEGRATMGGSSGGSCAFTMGWFRPDLYRRILTLSGTFVNQHPDQDYPLGAWEYHENLIPSMPAKPLRVFIQVGQNDLRFGDRYHDWIAANEQMADVLAEAGYHYRYVYSEGANHVDGRVLREILPDTLRWLWRGYPIPASD